ncbi:MAG: hypothetical protein QOF52_116, partial [Propionibacteriaceae bacterium]|nr:hypothetical protein [Propionibacteriaceae bacterium]
MTSEEPREQPGVEAVAAASSGQPTSDVLPLWEATKT